MGRRRAGWLVLMYCQLSTALALWLAVAVPVACHHAAPQPLFLAAPHDHGVTLHAAAGPIQPPDGQLAAADAGPASDTPARVGERCTACHLHAASSAADSLAVPVAALPAAPLAVSLLAVRRLPVLGHRAPATAMLPAHDPPPRSALPATGA